MTVPFLAVAGPSRRAVTLCAVILRAVTLYAVILRAVTQCAVILRAVTLCAVILRAVTQYAVILRAVTLCAVILRAVTLCAVILRAMILRAVILHAVTHAPCHQKSRLVGHQRTNTGPCHEKETIRGPTQVHASENETIPSEGFTPSEGYEAEGHSTIWCNWVNCPHQQGQQGIVRQ